MFSLFLRDERNILAAYSLLNNIVSIRVRGCLLSTNILDIISDEFYKEIDGCGVTLAN